MLITREEVFNIVNSIPHQIDTEELIYKLYVLEKIKKGINSADKNEMITVEELEEEIKR